MSSESPFLVEYARSEISKCKSCGQKIPVHELRIARRFQSGRFDGLQVNWFHAHCFFDQHRPLSEGDFDGFENIRNLHQEYIRMEIENSTNLVEYVAKKSKSESTLLEAVMSKSALRDYSLEYAKSGRAKCRHCMMPIEKGDLRAQKTIYNSDIGMKFGGEPLWHHFICFVTERHQLGWLGRGEQLPGYKKIRKADQTIVDEMLRPTLKQLDDHKPIVKKEEDKMSLRRRRVLRLQNEKYFKNRDFCEKRLIKKEMVAILRMNHQDVPRGSNLMLDLLADVLTFGALERCPKCSGQLYLKQSTFECRGYLSEWSRCDYSSQKPDRRPACVPLKIREAFKFLDRDYPPSDRQFHNIPAKMGIEPVVKEISKTELAQRLK